MILKKTKIKLGDLLFLQTMAVDGVSISRLGRAMRLLPSNGQLFHEGHREHFCCIRNQVHQECVAHYIGSKIIKAKSSRQQK